MLATCVYYKCLNLSGWLPLFCDNLNVEVKDYDHGSLKLELAEFCNLYMIC